MSLDSPEQTENESAERAIWEAIGSLEQSADLSLRIAEQASERGQPGIARRFTARAEERRRHSGNPVRHDASGLRS